MSTTAILEAFLGRLQTLGLSPEIQVAWPGIHFDPPDAGMWLEPSHFPNEPTDPSWDNDSCALARGFFQVLVGFRPGGGVVQASLVADSVIAHFPKGTDLGGVRVRKKPWQSPPVTESDKLFIPVTIPYQGFTQ